jgi:CheY-like chemotaxis protein
VFRVKLQRAGNAEQPVARAAAAAAPDRPSALPRARILLVDDEPALLKTIERMLIREHDVVALPSARQAAEIIGRGERFDAILSDLMMPDMTGIELHATLSQTAPDQARRMIFMSGGALTPEAVKFFDSQANPSLDKPFSPSALRKAVGDALSALGPREVAVAKAG